MNFSLFSFSQVAEKTFWDYAINILGLIIIPLVIYFLSSVYGENKKDRINKIRLLNSLTLYCKNLLQESLKLINNEARRRSALQEYINNPTPENLSRAFYIARTPTLQYELFANDYAFTTNEYPPLVDLIYEVNSNLKLVTTAITEFNLHSELAFKNRDDSINIAQEMLLQLDDFHHKRSILSYIITLLMHAVQVYNSYYFFQNIIDLQFTGRMKEYIDSVTQEIQDFYGSQEPNWLNTMHKNIENIDNPPILFSIRGFYYKFCRFFDKNYRNIKKAVYLKLKEIRLKNFRKAKTACTNEKIKEIHEQYAKILSNYELCKEKYNSLTVINTSANLQLYKGLMLKLSQIIAAMKNIFKILPPERTILLTQEEITQVEINLNFITTNFIPCFNNIFKFLYLFVFPGSNIENIHFLSKELNEIIDENYLNTLHNFGTSELYAFIEAFDYSISNELPFELSGYLKDENGLYVGIKIIPNQKAKENGIKEFFIYDFVINSMNLLINTANGMYEFIIKKPQE